MSGGRKSHPKKNTKRAVKASVRKASGRHAIKDELARKVIARAARISASKEARLKTQNNIIKQKERGLAMQADNERMKVEVLLANVVFSDFISKNVGKRAINVIRMLNSPQTDDKLAAELNIKINEVRRILNVLDSYGVARYDTNKDSKGWLTFKWYLNGSKLSELNTEIINRKPESAYRLPEDCNDFFYCNACYKESKVILPFDAAFETQFKCDSCGKHLKQLSKNEAQALFDKNSLEQEKEFVPA